MIYLAAYIALVALAAGAFHYLIHRETAREAAQMTFLFTDHDGGRIDVEPCTNDDGTPVLVIDAPTVRIPLDRVEEVIAGIRDTARQAAGEPKVQIVIEPPHGDDIATHRDHVRRVEEFARRHGGPGAMRS